MRKIKASNNYLRNQALSNLGKAALLFFVSIAVFLFVIYETALTLQFTPWYIGLILGIAALVGFYYYLHKYRIYNGGLEGERQVAKLLSSSLSDDYYLINDLYLQGGGGDIDHVVLAPAGVFVLETKNWSGTIICQGDEWQRPGKRRFNSSPSQQVKRNAAKLRHIIDGSPDLRGFNVWVEGIVVLTNRHANVHLNNPTVPILKLPQLPSYITNHGGTRRFSREQLEAIGKEIAKQKA